MEITGNDITCASKNPLLFSPAKLTHFGTHKVNGGKMGSSGTRYTLDLIRISQVAMISMDRVLFTGSV